MPRGAHQRLHVDRDKDSQLVAGPISDFLFTAVSSGQIPRLQYLLFNHTTIALLKQARRLFARRGDGPALGETRRAHLARLLNRLYRTLFKILVRWKEPSVGAG